MKDKTNKSKECCEECWITHFRDFPPEDNIITEISKPFCCNDSCPCHTKSPQEKILSKKEIRDILGDKADIDYERNYSHYHCWHQEQPPACGIPLENHKQCCLCDKEYTPQKKQSQNFGLN